MVVTHPVGGRTPAAARHAVAVVDELVAPVSVMVFSTVTLQVPWNPAPVGKSGGLHWLKAGGGEAAALTGASGTTATANALTGAAELEVVGSEAAELEVVGSEELSAAKAEPRRAPHVNMNTAARSTAVIRSAPRDRVDSMRLAFT